MSIEQAYDHALPGLRAFLRQLGFNVNHSKLLGLIQHAFTLNSAHPDLARARRRGRTR